MFLKDEIYCLHCCLYSNQSSTRSNDLQLPCSLFHSPSCMQLASTSTHTTDSTISCQFTLLRGFAENYGIYCIFYKTPFSHRGQHWVHDRFRHQCLYPLFPHFPVHNLFSLICPSVLIQGSGGNNANCCATYLGIMFNTWGIDSLPQLKPEFLSFYFMTSGHART